MLKLLRPAIGVSVGLWLLLGLGYPLVMTGISQIAFPWQANGSQVKLNGKLVASSHVGQYFGSSMKYFWGRPSDTISVATGKSKPYNAYASAPSNYGPTNKTLIADIKGRIAQLIKTTPGLKVSQIPPNLVESSGSGLDPNISVQAALIQIPRIAKATKLHKSFLTHLVDQNIEGPQFGIFGVQRINVVKLNLALYKALHG